MNTQIGWPNHTKTPDRATLIGALVNEPPKGEHETTFDFDGEAFGFWQDVICEYDLNEDSGDNGVGGPMLYWSNPILRRLKLGQYWIGRDAVIALVGQALVIQHEVKWAEAYASGEVA